MTARPRHAIALRDLRFRWPGQSGHGLSLPHFDLAPGESLLLCGPSGCGKSTLLSLICGIITPNEGTVRIQGTDLSHLTGAQKDRFRANEIGLIFQLFNLLPHLTALDNILLALHFAPKRRARLNDPRAEALRLTTAMGLDPELVKSAKANMLSIGQQQRVAGARALIGDPGLVVADEPTSALDIDSQSQFVSVLKDQCRRAGAALLLVSHDPALATQTDRMLALPDITANQQGAA